MPSRLVTSNDIVTWHQENLVCLTPSSTELLARRSQSARSLKRIDAAWVIVAQRFTLYCAAMRYRLSTRKPDRRQICLFAVLIDESDQILRIGTL
jgi:hypothetical protein